MAAPVIQIRRPSVGSTRKKNGPAASEPRLRYWPTPIRLLGEESVPTAASCGSEQVGFLHDAEKLFLVHLPVAITIGFVDHLLKLLVRHPLPELLRHPLQVLERYLPGLVVVEEPECFQDLVLRITIQDLVRHHLQELLVPYRPAPVVVHVRDHLLDLLLLWLEAESAHRDLQLLGVDLAGAVRVEQVERLLDLLLLLLGELLLLLAALVEAAQSHWRSGKSLGRGPM